MSALPVPAERQCREGLAVAPLEVAGGGGRRRPVARCYSKIQRAPGPRADGETRRWRVAGTAGSADTSPARRGQRQRAIFRRVTLVGFVAALRRSG